MNIRNITQWYIFTMHRGSDMATWDDSDTYANGIIAFLHKMNK